MRSTDQARSLQEDAEPHDATAFIGLGTRWIEDSIKAVLDRYTATEPSGMGAWAREIVGIGPVISAGLLAHKVFDPRFATVGHTWAYAGLDPDLIWLGKEGAAKLAGEVLTTKDVTPEQVAELARRARRSMDYLTNNGQKDGEWNRAALVSALAKRPWNARLKSLCCFKLGESFVKFSNHPRDIYGKLYQQRKAQEQARNDAGAFADQAAAKLAKFRIGRDTEAYKWYSAGKLPPAHIHRRAVRYAVKIFLSHYHAEAYRRHFGEEPPKPFAVAILGHGHMIERPNPTT